MRNTSSILLSPILGCIVSCMCVMVACKSENRITETHQAVKETKINHLINLTGEQFTSLQPVTVAQTPDAVFKRDIEYTAYPLNEVLQHLFPDWQKLIEENAVLIMKSTGGYAPKMPFADGFSGTAYIATKFANRSPSENPYDCWDEGGEQHCDLGFFLIWTDGFYPDRPQPWGLEQLEVVSFQQAYGKAIPQTTNAEVIDGFDTYRKYCIECHRVNFDGGAKGTEHVVRAAAIPKQMLQFYLYEYRKNNPKSYMPDFSDKIKPEQLQLIFTYLDYMHHHQNLCVMDPDNELCKDQTGNN